MTDAPDRMVQSADGTPIAVFSDGAGPPLVLVHGAAADHTTFRVVGPMLARGYEVHAVDRRGRGASGDTEPYGIEREFEDVAAVVDAIAAEHGEPVDVVGHSFGGRVGLGAALRTPSLRRLVVYEGAPPAADRPNQRPELLATLRGLRDAGEPERLLETFLRDIVGMAEADLAAYRANPVWPARVGAAPTIVREVEAEASPEAGIESLGVPAIPVLLVLGSASAEPFHAATRQLAGRLPDGRVAVIGGARHAAHHTHPDAFVAGVEAFLGRST